MTINKNAVLWDNGKDRLCMFSVSTEQQYQYIDGIPCISFGVSYENAGFKGCDIFTLFDRCYMDTISAIDKAYHCMNGTFRIDDSGADTDGFLNFEMNNGRLIVKGQLGASVSSHSLTFAFEADQTLIGALLSAITT